MFSDTEWKNLMNITNTLYRKNTMASLSTYILDELFSLLKPSLVEFSLGAPCRNSIPSLKIHKYAAFMIKILKKDLSKNMKILTIRWII